MAWNLKAARKLRGWSQAEAIAAIEPHRSGGSPFSVPSYSAAERSADPSRRSRHFTADDIVAFSAAFDLPYAWFLLPPAPEPISGDVLGRIIPFGYPDFDNRVLEQGTGDRSDLQEQMRQGLALWALTTIGQADERANFERWIDAISALADLRAVLRFAGDEPVADIARRALQRGDDE